MQRRQDRMADFVVSPALVFYRWRKEYGGLRTDQAKRLKELEKENQRLKRLLADAELDKAILKEAASGNF
jgi:putative transposase